MNTPIRPHLTEEAFRKYEGHLWQIVNCFPVKYIIKPPNCKTFSARLRDAKKSLFEFQWTTSINVDKFREIYDDLVILERPPEVWCGSKQRFKKETPEMEIPVEIMSNDIADIGELNSLPALLLLCDLAQSRALAKPIQFSSNCVSEQDLVESYDIGLKNLGQNKWVII